MTTNLENRPFKDRFEYLAESDTSTLEITAQQPDGSWKHSARCDFRQPT